MISTLPSATKIPSVRAQVRRSSFVWWFWFLGLLSLTSLLGVFFLRRTPTPAAIGWLCFLVAVIAIFYQPRYGVYMLAGLTLVCDSILTPWYPFVKNLSSGESLLYLGRATIFSP